MPTAKTTVLHIYYTNLAFIFPKYCFRSLKFLYQFIAKLHKNAQKGLLSVHRITLFIQSRR